MGQGKITETRAGGGDLNVSNQDFLTWGPLTDGQPMAGTPTLFLTVSALSSATQKCQQHPELPPVPSGAAGEDQLQTSQP